MWGQLPRLTSSGEGTCRAALRPIFHRNLRIDSPRNSP
jgi:hypothetical protein